MPINTRRVYLEANVLLAFVNNEENRSDTVQSLLDDARESTIQAVTSVLSITEVAYVAADSSGSPSTDDEMRIDQLWTPASPLTLVDLSVKEARAARSVIRKAKRLRIRRVRSADAIHLATAELSECDLFFTYENASTRKGWNKLIKAKVSEPVTSTPRLGLEHHS